MLNLSNTQLTALSYTLADLFANNNSNDTDGRIMAVYEYYGLGQYGTKWSSVVDLGHFGEWHLGLIRDSYASRVVVINDRLNRIELDQDWINLFWFDSELNDATRVN